MTMVARPILVSLAGVVLAATLAAQPSGGRTPDTAPTTAGSLLRLALAGDAIITRRLSVYREPAFLRLMDLVRGADAAFVNLEMLFHDFEPYPMNESGGTYMRAEPALLRELTWAGFDMVARANNHAGDYGVEGMRLTSKHVVAAGLVEAGVGEDLAEAREARYLETAKGRIALISVASTFPDHSRAGRARGGVRGRPGLNPLRFTTTYTVTRARFDLLRATLQELGLRAGEGDRLAFMGSTFVVGDSPGVRTEPRQEDVEEIVAVVKGASALADQVLVTFHGHEGRPGDRFVAGRLPRDVRARRGRRGGHARRRARARTCCEGIELYKGKPIFYSIGDFIFQNETVLRLPSENYEPYDLGPAAQVSDFNARRYDNDRRGFPAEREIWEAIVAVPSWHSGRLAAVELHPITLGFGKPPAERGRPQLAEGDLAQKIIGDLARLSAPFGTTITFEQGIGRLVLPGGSPPSAPGGRVER